MTYTIVFLLLPTRKKEINDEDLRILAGEVFSGEKALKLELSAGYLRKIRYPCGNCR